MRIDLHTHSDASDGTESPAEVMAAAAAAGLDVVALTDHDTTRGWAEAEVAAREHGVALVRGVELSCRHDGRSLHLLSYLHDPADPVLLAEADRVRAARTDRAHAMVDLLSRDYPLTWADVEEQTGADATVGRPHIADALVALGVVPDRSAAFADILATGSPYWVPHHAIRLVDAISLVLEAGGVPVLAHPGAVDRGRAVSEAEVALPGAARAGRARGLAPGQPSGRAGPAGRARGTLRAARPPARATTTATASRTGSAST